MRKAFIRLREEEVSARAVAAEGSHRLDSPEATLSTWTVTQHWQDFELRLAEVSARPSPDPKTTSVLVL